jgi:hypothetical protein
VRGPILTLLSIATAGAARAQSQGPGAAPLAYSARQLDCSRFAESSRSDVETETARGSVKVAISRDGILSFRARDSAGGVALEAWYDSLALRRSAGEHEHLPDTDGVIGGRYRGFLGPTGAYTDVARPFVPDEVAEVADLRSVAADLLPPLPPKPLRAGESWEAEGLALTRLPDTAVAGRPLHRLRLELRRESRETVPRGDTVPVPVRQTTVERGEIYWSPASGLVRRIRDITVEATVPSGGRVPRPVRSRVVQRVELTRLPARPGCAAG